LKWSRTHCSAEERGGGETICKNVKNRDYWSQGRGLVPETEGAGGPAAKKKSQSTCAWAGQDGASEVERPPKVSTPGGEKKTELVQNRTLRVCLLRDDSPLCSWASWEGGPKQLHVFLPGEASRNSLDGPGAKNRALKYCDRVGWGRFVSFCDSRVRKVKGLNLVSRTERLVSVCDAALYATGYSISADRGEKCSCSRQDLSSIWRSGDVLFPNGLFLLGLRGLRQKIQSTTNVQSLIRGVHSLRDREGGLGK